MLRRGNLGTFIGLGLLAELCVFAVVADRVGFGGAVGLSLVFSLLGVVMLRRSGTSALASLRGLAGNPRGREGAFVDGMLGAVGALLLIVPGFLSDLCGLLLLAPSGRQWVVRRFGLAIEPPAAMRRRGDPRTIDLGDTDFTRLDNVPGR
ncbi:MAG TPA: FxsA family protein [Lichenihabitans sp.]|jgi:UPF0716 protein FxsA|nr:FxsA family protein [Lichenihabitans sp.]